MKISINRNNDTPLYIQIKNKIKEKIISGILPTGLKLPPERAVAEDLHVSRNTVVRAYQELIAEGFLVVSSKPKGYFVREVIKPVYETVLHPLANMRRYNYTEKETLFEDIFRRSTAGEYVSFAGINVNYPDTDDFLVNFKELYECDENEANRLKRNICKMLSAKDIFVSEKNIQLVSETTQALGYIMSLYLRDGDTVIVEEPVVAGTVNVFRNKGANVVCVKMNEDGMDLNDLQRLIETYCPRFVYTMPNLHNPTGISMTLEKRLKLLEICGRRNVPIIEENSLGDFRYEGSELPSLYALDKNRIVLYVDTFNLTFLPGINTAFVAGPVETIDMIGRLIVTEQNTIYKISHALLNRFIESGRMDKRKKQLTEFYRNKRDVLSNRLLPLKEQGLSFEKPEGGLYIWCKLPDDVNEKKLFITAGEKGLLYMPGSVFFPYGYSGSGYIRLCFSNVCSKDIDRGVDILKAAMDISRDNFMDWRKKS